MVRPSKDKNGTAVVGIVLLVVAAVAVANWISMLVLGAGASYQGWDGPGFWETLFSLWSIGIIGSAFNGSKLVSKN